MVETPWFDREIPFNMAAEIGTRKVINEHSSIGLVITTDGSISDIPRAEYEEVENKIIDELKAIEKPFVMVLNCVNPNSEENRELRDILEEKHGVPVVAINCLELTESDIKDILGKVLFQFPVKEIKIDMPKWIATLDEAHWLKHTVYESIGRAAEKSMQISKLRDSADYISECEFVKHCDLENVDLGTGSAKMNISVNSELYYKILSESTGLDIGDESQLIPCMKELAAIKIQYDKIRDALDEVSQTGYGIVMPSISELSLEEPEIIKQGGKYGVKLKASAPSIHMMRADITTEVSPIVGSEKQSEELVSYLLGEFDENPAKIWDSNIFGKSLNELVNEGLHNKLLRMPIDARMKLQETVERVINEGCSGLICIIL